MLKQEIENEIRSLHNRLRTVDMRIVELDTEDKKIARQRDETEIEKRKHSKAIRFHKDSIADLESLEEEMNKKEFEFGEEKKTLKKQKEELRIALEQEQEKLTEQERTERMAAY